MAETAASKIAKALGHGTIPVKKPVKNRLEREVGTEWDSEW
ncbi:hypothetical protein UF75_3942 [Desulfosporosinus sp. I2]|nr:hypothetical protein UF75_3942 [Desulfosporosinus sp. I2]